MLTGDMNHKASRTPASPTRWSGASRWSLVTSSGRDSGRPAYCRS